MNIVQELIVRIRQVLIVSGETGRFVLVAIAIVAALVVIFGGLAHYSRSTPRGRVRRLLDEVADVPSADNSVWVVRIGVPLLFLAALVGANVYAGQPSTCSQCHSSEQEAAALALSPHAELACMKCHTPGGFTGVVSRNVTYVRWFVTWAIVQQEPDPSAGSVGNAACLRCHRGVTDGVITARGIRVRHSDFLESGSRCRDCHNSTAHPNAVKEPSVPSMDHCVVCHDGDTASSECTGCHVQDVAMKPEEERGYSKLRISGGDDACYQCHDEAPCIRCHGVRMPHPAGWSPNERLEPGYGHARDGFANREVCWRCHFAKGKPLVPANEACACHGLFGKMHNGASWVKEHGLQATGVRSGSKADCFFCHGGDLCERCHPPSYRERYAPNPSAPRSPGYVESTVPVE
jgi:hypothetical protein